MNDQIPNESTPLPQEPPDFHLFGSEEQISKLFSELASAQGEFGSALADSVGKINEQRTFKYADLASIIAASRPALSKHGISLTQWPTGYDGAVLTIVAGHGARIHSVLRFERPKLPKEQGAYWTYMCRYAMRAILGLPGDDDLDNTPQAARDERPRGNPPPPPTKGNAGARPLRPRWAGSPVPSAEPAQGPGPQATPAQALSHAREQREKIEAANAQPIETTGEDMSATIVDDINGPDGEAVDDDRPEFRDPNPASDETKKLIQATQTKLLSLNGTGKDIALPLRIAILKRAANIEATPGQKIALTEGEGQRIVAFLYEVATDLKIDPDGMVSQAEVKMAVKAFEKRVGLVS